MKILGTFLAYGVFAVGLLFTGLFIVQLVDVVFNPSEFAFFQIIMVFIWLLGAIFFDIIGVVLIKVSRKSDTDEI